MSGRESRAALTARAIRIAATLEELYPEGRISLDFTTPWECLAATILSAQCTDARVNRVTPELFHAIPDVKAMAAAPLEKIEKLIVTTGFFRSKARSLKTCAAMIVDQFGGDLPDTIDELVQLPGVGRKTANVILGHVFGRPGFVVDTHVRRLTYRLGLTRQRDPEKIETDLTRILPPEKRTGFSMRLILHGRRVCHARGPKCDQCAVAPDCPRIGVVARPAPESSVRSPLPRKRRKAQP